MDYTCREFYFFSWRIATVDGIVDLNFIYNISQTRPPKETPNTVPRANVDKANHKLKIQAKAGKLGIQLPKNLNGDLQRP